MKRLLPLLLLLSFSAQAQELLHCGADEMRIQTLQTNPKIAQAVIERDAELEAFTREYALRQAQGTQRGGSLYIIPVVFHVIHKYGNENISREQMLDGLRILNETFRKTREDTADIVAAFKPIHADCEIEFRLATKDPEGNCHSGINRIASALTNTGDHQVKELIHWDPSMYLNVYVVSNAAGLAGHCVWPADADTIPEWDGIVIAHNYVGTIGTSNLTTSVAFAHECGHYLNLHHIWGGNNVPNFFYLPVGQQSNCGEDDLVEDTPNTIGWSNCNLGASSCGNTVDNVQNAMDYSYCNIMFTEGQKTRMHACLNSTIANRNNLWSQSNLIATGVLPEPAPLCGVDFVADRRVVCPNFDNTVTFTNASYHAEADSLLWEFEGGFPPTSTLENPTVAYSQPGMYTVALTAYSNGNAVGRSYGGYITVLQDSSWSVPFWEPFEEEPSVLGPKWVAFNVSPNMGGWTSTHSASYSPYWAATAECWDSDRITFNELYGPPIDLSGVSEMRLAFRYAFASMEPPSSTTKLQLQVTRNCETTWSTRLNIIGQSLVTAGPQTGPFLPEWSDWVLEDINIPSAYLDEGFRFRFVFTSEGGNRLFLDDINIDVSAGISETEDVATILDIYPNPAEDRLTVKFDLKKPSNVQLSLLDVLGNEVMTTNRPLAFGTQTTDLNVGQLSAGVYMLQLQCDHQRAVKRVVVQ